MIEIYTDGSASVNGKTKGLGGFGIVFTIDGQVKKVLNRGYRNTKTGRMELMAIRRLVAVQPHVAKLSVAGDAAGHVRRVEDEFDHRVGDTIDAVGSETVLVDVHDEIVQRSCVEDIGEVEVPDLVGIGAERVVSDVVADRNHVMRVHLVVLIVVLIVVFVLLRFAAIEGAAVMSGDAPCG